MYQVFTETELACVVGNGWFIRKGDRSFFCDSVDLPVMLSQLCLSLSPPAGGASLSTNQDQPRHGELLHLSAPFTRAVITRGESVTAVVAAVCQAVDSLLDPP